MGKHVRVEKALVFCLGILETLEDNGYEKIQEDQVHKDVETKEVKNPQFPRTTAHRLVTRFYIIFISGVSHALEFNGERLDLRLHDCAPGIGSRNGTQNTEGIGKILKVQIFTHDTVSLNLA